MQARWASASTPATLPEVPRRSDANGGTKGHILCLNSVNDPAEWGLASSPQGSSEPAYYWLGSSLSNPKEHCSPRASMAADAHSPLPLQPHTRTQRIVFRSSMADPELPKLAPFSSSPLPAEHQPAFQSSMTDPPLRPLRRPTRAAKVAGTRLQR